MTGFKHGYIAGYSGIEFNTPQMLEPKQNYGQASYTDWLHLEKCPNVTNQGTIPTVVSPINVQCLSVYTDKHCTLIGDISK